MQLPDRPPAVCVLHVGNRQFRQFQGMWTWPVAVGEPARDQHRMFTFFTTCASAPHHVRVWGTRPEITTGRWGQARPRGKTKLRQHICYLCNWSNRSTAESRREACRESVLWGRKKTSELDLLILTAHFWLMPAQILSYWFHSHLGRPVGSLAWAAASEGWTQDSFRLLSGLNSSPEM